MIAIDRTPVAKHENGQALSPIWWRSKQWAVTEYGLECLDGRYAIRSEDIGISPNLEAQEDSWIAHMSEKNWVDMHDFTTALGMAIFMHGDKPRGKAMRETFKQFVRPSLRKRPSLEDICAEIDSE